MFVNLKKNRKIDMMKFSIACMVRLGLVVLGFITLTPGSRTELFEPIGIGPNSFTQKEKWPMTASTLSILSKYFSEK